MIHPFPDPWSGVRHQARELGGIVKQTRTERAVSQARLMSQVDPDGIYKDITVPNISRWEQGTLIPSVHAAQLLHQWVLQTPQRHNT